MATWSSGMGTGGDSELIGDHGAGRWRGLRDEVDHEGESRRNHSDRAQR